MIINQSSGRGSSSSNNSQVGDMLYTERKPDMSKWLECNGAQISTSEYKELFNVLGKKYGSQGDVAATVRSNVDSGFVHQPIILNNGKAIIDEFNGNNTIARYILDLSTGNYTQASNANTRQRSYYHNTAVVLPDGDVIAQCADYKVSSYSYKGVLSRISNIDTNSSTTTQLSSLIFGSSYYNSVYYCTAQIVHDAKNSRYLILVPKNNTSSDEDGAPYWDYYYQLYSTTDFNSFTLLIDNMNYNSRPYELIAAGENIYIRPMYVWGDSPVYILENNSFQQITTKDLSWISYCNGFYYATKGYNSTSEPTGIYYSSDGKKFSQLYNVTNFFKLYISTSSANTQSFTAYITPYSENEILIQSSGYVYSDSSTCGAYGGIYRVNNDGTLTLKNIYYSYSDSSWRSATYVVTDGNVVIWKNSTTIYRALAYPTHFKLPSFYNAYGATNSSYHGTTATSPTPYIRAKD